jgi:hypothetical protein
MGRFYGINLFLAESSATTGGLDSLLEPAGNIKLAQELAARGNDSLQFSTSCLDEVMVLLPILISTSSAFC